MEAMTVVLAAKVCPKAPPGAVGPTNEITGYVLWGVIILFGLGIIIAIGAIIAGRVFSLPHASKVGVISVVVVFACAIAYLVLPGMLNGILGRGCI
ncbi:hypothetical protein D0Z08_04770 [Nocardioides immobilis]|uniref:Uncharacterized protein n=2 Tax=Nocardioides immobilis TaxID=2049295 RepID=A0A417Y6I7_9ACTN|nr:hypothetical protein D0Z08_04770 [Nocardioides immobilis]